MTSFSMSMFSTSCPPSPLPTDEEFNLYHSIDRQLYKVLIFNLGRDIRQSMHVMAFWLWLEQQHTGGMTLVKRMLSLPVGLINDLADEAVLCLECVEKDEFSYPETTFELALLPTIVGRNVTLKSLHEQRIRVLRGVTLMLNQVCSRVFPDINQDALNVAIRRLSAQDGDVNRRAISPDRFEADPSRIGNTRPIVSTTGVYFTRAPGGVAKRQGMQQSREVNDELTEIFSGNLNILDEEGNDISPDDRTIFLTFSRGYPISEGEVTDFFRRKFGDFIEEIHMQEVPAGQQVLYARVVAREAWMIDVVVEGGRAKYNINGKHVCARKFVNKRKLLAAASASPSSSSSSGVLKQL